MEKIKQIIQHIIKAPKIALFHHINPDGDSLSSSYGLLLAIKKKFPKKLVVMVGDKEAIKNSFGFLNINYDFFQEKIDNSFLAIIGDTSVSHRIEKYQEFQKAQFKICFDHHQSDTNVKYDIFWKDATYPASAMQAFEIVEHLKVALDQQISLFLAVGILTDTNNFTFSLSNFLAPLYYSKLLKNISHETINHFFNNLRNRTIQDVKLQQEILNNIKFYGKVAYVVFNKNKVNKFPQIEQKNMVNLIGNIENFSIWVMFIYNENSANNQPLWDIHFRSNGPHVSQVAIELGGGGHYRAAGAKISASISPMKIVKKLNDLA